MWKKGPLNREVSYGSTTTVKGYIRITVAPPVTEWQRSKLEDGRCQVQTPVALADLAVRSYPCFLKNSHKYRLGGSLRKTFTEGTPPIFHSNTSGQLDSNLQPTKRITVKRNHLSCYKFCYENNVLNHCDRIYNSIHNLEIPLKNNIYKTLIYLFFPPFFFRHGINFISAAIYWEVKKGWPQLTQGLKESGTSFSHIKTYLFRLV